MFTYPITSASLVSDLQGSLLAYWKLDEVGTVDRLDSHTGGYTLSRTGGGTLANRAGILGQAPDFRGVSDNGLFNASTNFRMAGQSFSISCWAYCDTANDSPITGRSTSASPGSMEWNISRIAGSVKMVFGSAVHSVTGGTMNNTTWYHIVFTYSYTTGNTQLILNDGSPATSTHGAGVVTGSPEAELWIGGKNGIEASMNGAVDEYGIWTRVLNSAEITALYNGGTGITYADF